MAKTPEGLVKEYAAGIVQEIRQWKEINEHGCSDPTWPDGVNMNLTRNHIISYKKKITELCEAHGIKAPDKLLLPIPPEVENGYMAKGMNSVRVERFQKWGTKLTFKKANYDENQLAFW